jgi:hypothetical protein
MHCMGGAFEASQIATRRAWRRASAQYSWKIGLPEYLLVLGDKAGIQIARLRLAVETRKR